jgi:ABC-type polysaccharide/polyol phosphate transport system ATPase subunit
MRIDPGVVSLVAAALALLDLTMARVQLSKVGVTFRIFDAGQRSFKRQLMPLDGSPPPVGIDALRDIDLTLEPGTRLGVLGLNSAGKTTLMRVMAGLVPPKQGSVRVEGTPGAVFSMGFGVDPEASLADLAYAQGLLMGLTPKQARAKIAEILDFAELDEKADRQAQVTPPGILSRFGIAAILCLGADVILLDEVMENLDPHFHDKFGNAIRARVDQGAILVMIERSRELLTRFCSEAVVLRDGRITGRASLDEILLRGGAPLTF